MVTKKEKPEVSPEDVDPKKLYVTGFPHTVEAVDVFRKQFVTSSEVTVPVRKKTGLPIG